LFTWAKFHQFQFIADGFASINDTDQLYKAIDQYHCAIRETEENNLMLEAQGYFKIVQGSSMLKERGNVPGTLVVSSYNSLVVPIRYQLGHTFTSTYMKNYQL
jgi:hypothetical protein